MVINMADLMTGTYTYDMLEKKYGNFHIPLIRIKMNGTDLVSTMHLAIVEFRAMLSLDAAGMVVVKIGDCYDEKNHSFDQGVKNRFLLGSVMEVELGYLSSSTCVFKGFVAMISAEFTKLPMIVVTLMDVRRLMMLSGNRYVLHDVKNYSDAFNIIMGQYSKLCSPVVDATSDDLKKPVSQTQNDYMFVKNELIGKGRVDREFFVIGDKAYFRIPHKISQPAMNLRFGRELLALKNEEGYRDLKISVSGYDSEAQKTLWGEADVKSSRRQKKLISSTPVLTVADPAVDNQKMANAKAKAIAEKKEWNAMSGQAVTIGLPELVPGRFVKVSSLEADMADHKYYIRSVVHEIKGDRFHTIFEIGGWTQ